MAVQAPVLKCIGIKGFCEGEVVVVKPGRQIIVGRSRSCEFSLRRAKKYMAADPDSRDADSDFQTVSRQHVKLSYVGPDDVRVEDLSSNGTFVAGERISAIRLSDLMAFAYDIQLGTRETLRIQIAEDVPVKRRIEPAGPPPVPADAPEKTPPVPDQNAGNKHQTPPPPPKPPAVKSTDGDGDGDGVDAAGNNAARGKGAEDENKSGENRAAETDPDAPKSAETDTGDAADDNAGNDREAGSENDAGHNRAAETELEESKPEETDAGDAAADNADNDGEAGSENDAGHNRAAETELDEPKSAEDPAPDADRGE